MHNDHGDETRYDQGMDPRHGNVLADGSRGPDMSLDRDTQLHVRSVLRAQLVAQFHQVSISARLNRTVGNDALALAQEEDARKITRMVAELDRDEAPTGIPTRLRDAR